MRIAEDELGTHFDIGQPRHVGVLLGTPSGDLGDVDLDCPEAVALAHAFLLPTPCRFGRASKPNSHWEYFVTPALPNTSFKDPNGKTLVEICSTARQVVMPPSVHQSGVVIRFDSLDMPTACLI